MKKFNHIFYIFIISLLVFVPMVSLAQGNVGCNSILPDNDAKIQDVFAYVSCILVRSVIPLMFGIALVSFFWGVINYVINGDSEERKRKGRQFMIWGIIGMTVMVSIWGIVNLFGATFKLKTNTIPQLPPLEQ